MDDPAGRLGEGEPFDGGHPGGEEGLPVGHVGHDPVEREDLVLRRPQPSGLEERGGRVEKGEALAVRFQIGTDRREALRVRPQFGPGLDVAGAVQGVVGDGQQQPQQREFLGGQVSREAPRLGGLGEDLTQRQLLLRAVTLQDPDPRLGGQVE